MTDGVTLLLVITLTPVIFIGLLFIGRIVLFLVWGDQAGNSDGG